MISWPPSSANAAEKIDEPTNSQQTIAVVFAVRNDDSLMMSQRSASVRAVGDAAAPRRASRTCP